MNWTYAPNSNDSLGEVAAKIVGKDIAAHCTSWSMSSADLEGGALQDGWEIDALLASADADIDKVRNVNQYISIDGRCVNPDRRSMMDIVRTYRKYLQGTLDSSDSTRIARPFLVMRVRCPPESYDVNVEPAKDEVIFFLPEALLSLVEGLFRKAYGDIDDGKNTLNPSEKGSNSIFRTHENMDAVSLDDSDGLETPMQDNTRGKSREVDDTIPEEPARWNPFTLAAMNAVVRPKKMQVPARSSTVNLPSPPLTGPKTGETSDQPRLPVASSHRIPLGSESHLPSPDASGSTRASQNSSPIRNRPTDAPRNVEDDDNDGGPRQTTTVLQAWLTPDSAVRVHLPQPNRTLNLVPPRENISTNPAFEPTGGRERSMSPLKKLQGGLKWGPGQKQFKPPSKVSSSHPHGHPSMPPPPEPERRRRSHSPPSRNTPDEDDTTERNRTRLDAGSERRSLGSSFDQEVEEDNFSTFDAELSEIMDFEYRKKAAIAHQKRLAKAETTTSHKELEPRQRFLTDHGSALSNDDRTTYFTDDETRSRSQAQSHTASSRRLGFNNPHQNRYVAALRDLSQPSHPQQQQRQSNNDTDDDASSTRAEDAPSVEHENETPAPSTSPSIYPRLSEDQNDPRAYLIRQQQRQRTSNSKIYRTKSSNPKLPFESIPTDAATLCLVLHTDAFADLSRIQKQVRVIGSVDRYLTQKIDHGHDDHHHADFELSSSEINDKITPQEWEHVLREMIERKYHPLLKPLQMVQN
ncbi:hypothetical protein HRR80_001121 [Exophiala dermatitidis]|nr:hypothetical protein HRR76_007830 [Exophiala dermatitidis]KAJ4538879.1 hypothetical protein HRR77_006801 [Exophiala dermatitidis]KAJ4573997.1 hypothetical protein HRR79_003002 [Exophiala dermatitidis]KAJ4583740.1 hypothetical protein HRR82_003086 [Exophiala dermatitidis]KAJ4623946.1 hypothetical protein HRR85_000796 [Exophiala dermatitidis]